MSETVPLESVSRWSGLSPWVALLPWRMAGAAPPESSPGRAPSCIWAQGPAPDRSRGEDLCDACGVGGRGMEARRGSGRGRQRPPCGVLPGGTERPFKQAQEGGDPGSKQSIEAPRLPYGSSTVACATTAPGHSPIRAEGKPSPRASSPAGCAPRRRCRAASASPGQPRPQASRHRRRAPGRRLCPCPGCRPARPGPRTAASPGPSTRRRPTEPDAAQP